MKRIGVANLDMPGVNDDRAGVGVCYVETEYPCVREGVGYRDLSRAAEYSVEVNRRVLVAAPGAVADLLEVEIEDLGEKGGERGRRTLTDSAVETQMTTAPCS